jgi:murein DD-endopeptidase MepM/ murein hydrolase activator NlpD
MKNLNEEISRLRELMNLNETSSMSSSLSGGKNITIPVSGAHKGQKGWQSANAWDIKMNIGDPVYSVSDGTVKTFSDYGPKIKSVDGKKLFGAGFTVDSDGGLPDVYYTHLMNCQVKKGDKIKCGQLLGYVMDFPNSDYDHLHIGVEDNNISRFIDSNGNLFCAKGKKLSSTDIKATKTDSDTEEKDTEGEKDTEEKNTKTDSNTKGGGYYDSFIGTMIKSALPFLGGNKI